MEFFNSAVGVTLTVGFVLLLIVLIFRKSIIRRIEEGSSFSAEISGTSAKLILGNREEGIPPPGTEEVDEALPRGKDQHEQLAPAQIPVDPKLVHVIPPMHPERFRTFPFPILDNPQSYNFPFAPSGLALFNGVPFFLRPTGDNKARLVGHQVLNVQPDEHNNPTVRELNAFAEGISFVHFLISAGHGRVSHEGVQFIHKRIGHLELIYADDTSQRVNLVLGRNIREWAFGNPFDLVRDIDDSAIQPAWVSHNSFCRIDHLTVSVQGGPRDLRSIQIAAKFEDDQPGRELMVPAIILSAVTGERTTDL